MVAAVDAADEFDFVMAPLFPTQYCLVYRMGMRGCGRLMRQARAMDLRRRVVRMWRRDLRGNPGAEEEPWPTFFLIAATLFITSPLHDTSCGGSAIHRLRVPAD